MHNKFKIIKKIISIALALVMASSSIASLPMNVFAGTGKNGVTTAPKMGQQQQFEAATAELEKAKKDLAAAQGENEGLQQQLQDLQNQLNTAQGEKEELQN